MVSGYPTSTSFLRVDGWSTDPQVLGCHTNNHFIILSLHVDELLIAINYKKLIDVTKKLLSSNFEMKDMGEGSYVLGVKILRDRSKHLLGLSQETYIKKMLQRYHMHDCKPMDTFLERNLSLSLDCVPSHLKRKNKCPKYLTLVLSEV